ncbi:hypothetical protein PS854_05536 [Pseudomonas fluorescens]|uniref:Uncharacterized protein n=1 Tax=Pseudomonas fluorescens TaxID=294 RepID=A0A5E7PY78_PSEFL|nr:hypothetical protein PS854_05536 [Pseudomonas fluorescens]
MLLALLYTRITCFCSHHVLFTVQQLVHLGNVRNVGGRDVDVVHQPRLRIALNKNLGT